MQFLFNAASDKKKGGGLSNCTAPICESARALYGALSTDDRAALDGALSNAEDLDNVYFHYSDRKGFVGIVRSDGVISPGKDGLVYLTTDMLSVSEVHNALFMAAPDYADKGTHVFALEVYEGVLLTPGTQPNEVTHKGSLRAGKHMNILYGGENPF